MMSNAFIVAELLMTIAILSCWDDADAGVIMAALEGQAVLPSVAMHTICPVATGRKMNRTLTEWTREPLVPITVTM